MNIDDLLAFGVKHGASDLHLSAGLPPMIRVDGDVRRINLPPMEHKQVHSLIYDIMNDKQRKDFEEYLEVDFLVRDSQPGTVPSQRVQSQSRRRWCLPNDSHRDTFPGRTGLPRHVQEYRRRASRGLVLVTGPTGSGKSTTLAAMIDYKNKNEYGHILTIEDPIEFVHESNKCLVNQREVHRDTLGFSEALRSALREDPDITRRRDARPGNNPACPHSR